MKTKQTYTNKPFLIVSTAVRVLFWKNKTELPPEFDENGFPVMAGDDEFYQLATNFGRNDILTMTFEPAAEQDSFENWTLQVRLSKSYRPGERLVLREGDKYLIVSSYERYKYREAEIFGVVNEKAHAGRFAEELEELEEKNHQDWLESNGGRRIEYDADFGA